MIWAARHEMARNLEDVLSRRTRALLLDAAAAEAIAPQTAALLARELGKSEQWAQDQVERFTRLCRQSGAVAQAERPLAAG